MHDLSERVERIVGLDCLQALGRRLPHGLGGLSRAQVGLAVLLDLLELGLDLPVGLTVKRELLKRAGLLEHGAEACGVEHAVPLGAQPLHDLLDVLGTLRLAAHLHDVDQPALERRHVLKELLDALTGGNLLSDGLLRGGRLFGRADVAERLGPLVSVLLLLDVEGIVFAPLLEHREFVGVKHVIHTLSHSSSLFP